MVYVYLKSVFVLKYFIGCDEISFMLSRWSQSTEDAVANTKRSLWQEQDWQVFSRSCRAVFSRLLPHLWNSRNCRLSQERRLIINLFGWFKSWHVTQPVCMRAAQKLMQGNYFLNLILLNKRPVSVPHFCR
jgi:hypothetical protein